MRILCVMDAPAAIRHAAPVLPALVQDENVVMVAFNACSMYQHCLNTGAISDPRIDWVGTFPNRDDEWAPIVRSMRGWMDVVRFFDERYTGATVLRDRMIKKILPSRPETPVWSEAHTNTVLRSLQDVAAVVPVSENICKFLTTLRPNVVVLTNLVDPQTDQADIVQAARHLGIPSVYVVTSWDNLTNRGRIHVKPDVIVVWNEHMRQEAIRFHDMPEASVRIAGAPVYDSWFARQPSCTREEFCVRSGLPSRPYLMYVGSSPFIAPSELEVAFVRKWQTVVPDWPILVRPHQGNNDAWLTAEIPNVTVWPRENSDVILPESLFDSLFYCSALVGVNSSVMNEAAILGKPTLTVLAPEFLKTQGGTLHFRYIREGGFVKVAHTFEEHREQLMESLNNPDRVRADAQAFVTTFFRPHGLDVPHTPIIAKEILSAASR